VEKATAVFKEALAAQRTMLVIASKCKKPGQADLEKVRCYGPPFYLVCWLSCRSFVYAPPAFPRCRSWVLAGRFRCESLSAGSVAHGSDAPRYRTPRNVAVSAPRQVIKPTSELLMKLESMKDRRSKQFNHLAMLAEGGACLGCAAAPGARAAHRRAEKRAPARGALVRRAPPHPP
jgi:hypothetical protein